MGIDLAALARRLRIRPQADVGVSGSTQTLLSYEAQIGAALPPLYREFVSRYGGQWLSPQLQYPIAEPCPWGLVGLVNVFYGASPRPTLDLAEAARTYVGRIPDETVPIGADPGDNLVLLGVEGMVRDQVFFWDHEHRSRTSSPAAMAADLERAGEDLGRLDLDGLTQRWEARFARQRSAYDDVYRVAATFEGFLDRLQTVDPTS